jgi:ABC exporter DevB family membrane fusion protein
MAGLTRKSLIASMVAVGCIAGYWQLGPARGVPADPATALAPIASASPSVAGPGRLEPESGEVDLAPDLAGVLASVPVKEGDRVHKGDIVAALVNEDAASRVDQAIATLRMQRARLDKLKKGPRVEERKQAVAAIQEQDATLARLQRDLAREKLLFRQGYASNAQLEQAQSAQAVALARKTSSFEALAQMDNGPRVEDVASAEAEVSLATARLEEAKATLEKTRIRAPIDGTVLRVYKHPGEAIGLGPASAVLQIGDLDHLVVRAQIDEADIARVAKGARAYVTAPAYPGKKFNGKVTDISPRLGAKTIQTGAPTEKRDASVLDVLVTLDPGIHLPIGLRVDCFILDRRSTS